LALTDTQKSKIQQVITNSLRNKFQNYNPEPASMPFHFRLLGKDRIALYSFLEWVAANPTANVQTLIAIPYNPYEPQPYNRWTMRGMLDLENELKVAEEFWDFIGGQGTYNELLDCFEKAGIELRPEIDEYFARFNR
jgi:hypothetical protein